MKFRRCDEAEALSQAGQRSQDFDPAQLPPGRDGRFWAPSVRLRFVPLAVALVLVIALLGANAAAAEREPLAGLHTWAATTQDSLGRNAGDRAVERRIARLRRLVPALAGPLRTAAPGRQRAALRHAREALGRSLELVAARLDFRQRWFFFTAYQAELERLARWVGLLRAPTGEVRLPAGRPLSPAEVLATLPDGDGDGRLDVAERDDDADGAPDGRDAFDHGWGIPDALQAREDADGDADDDGIADASERPRRVHSPCVFVPEPIPAFHTVRGAARWLAHAERERGCRVPRRAPRGGGGGVGGGARLAGVRVRGARIEHRTVRLRVDSARATRLSLSVRDGDRVLARGSVPRLPAGRRSVAVRLGAPPPDGVFVVRVRAPGAGAALIRARSGPPPLPAAVAFDPPVVQESVFGLAAPKPCPDPQADTDKDGVPDCRETQASSSPTTTPTSRPNKSPR